MSEPVVEPSNQPVLRREAILPRERRGGLGAVALLCSLAGVASGFALATTILATQIAQSEARASRRGYHQAAAAFEYQWGPALGVEYKTAPDGTVQVLGVTPDGAAAATGMLDGDEIVRFDGEALDRDGELARMVMGSAIGREVTLEVHRGDRVIEMHPRLQYGKVTLPRH
jgi:S1-C subfamily serine protease